MDELEVKKSRISFFELIKRMHLGLWHSLESKGKYTTAVGLGMVIAAVVKPLIEHNQGIIFSQDYMWQIIYFVLGGILLIILPSYMKISKDGFEVKD